MKTILSIFIAISLIGISLAQDVLKGKGKVNFVSDAPLEIIKASSDELMGVLNPAANTFAFKIAIASFIGFNSPLQQEHFNEHYLETSKYPTSTFTGKIIEKVDWKAQGSQLIRAKGQLVIHGYTVEKIIPVTIQIKDNTVIAEADFKVPLEEFNIKLPKVVFNKIAEEIDVKIFIEFNPAP